MRGRRIVLLPLLVTALAWSDYSDYLSARRKFESIESDRLRPGTHVTLTPPELNAWVREEAKQSFPDGVRQPVLELGSGTATGSALIDFDKVRRAQGSAPGWLASRLLQGERPVKVTARLISGAGRMKVEVLSVEVSGMAITGGMLDFLIRNYLQPNYPEAKVGQPFEMGHRIERLDVRPSSVEVVIGK